MKNFFTLAIILLILFTLMYTKSESFTSDIPDVLTESKVMEPSLLTSSAINNIDAIQKNQQMVFNLFMKEVEQNNAAKAVLLSEENKVYSLESFVNKINQMENKLLNKIEKHKDPECQEFANNYCVDTNVEFKMDESLYSLKPSVFKEKMDKCFDVCYTHDMEEVRMYRKLVFNTLFDIFLRFDVLKKTEGNIQDEQNKNKYEYLIQYNKEDSLFIEFDMSLFSPTHPKHMSFVVEILAFLKIINLTYLKLQSFENIDSDLYKVTLNNFIKQKYNYLNVDEEQPIHL